MMELQFIIIIIHDHLNNDRWIRRGNIYIKNLAFDNLAPLREETHIVRKYWGVLLIYELHKDLTITPEENS